MKCNEKSLYTYTTAINHFRIEQYIFASDFFLKFVVANCMVRWNSGEKNQFVKTQRNLEKLKKDKNHVVGTAWWKIDDISI